MAKKFPFSVVIEGVDRITAPLRRVNKRLRDMARPIKTLQQRFRMLGQEAGIPRIAKQFSVVAARVGGVRDKVLGLAKGLGIVTAAATGLAFIFKTQFIDTAAEFERFQTILETLEGTSAKAKKSMDWISDFAAETPFSLTEVTDAFVKLRAYGMDPTEGLLRTLGDTSAAMGKGVLQAVEAIADAVTGENERLKEFGIKARTQGNMIVYEYTENGKTMRKAADKSNRAMIQSTLEAIFNSKYAGAMDKMSRTWVGMMSNLGDQWDRFKVMVMDAGVFDFLKGEMQGLLDRVNAMAASGELRAFAEQFAGKILIALRAIRDFAINDVPKIWRGMKDLASGIKAVADFFGGWGNLAKVAAAAWIAPLVISIGQLTYAVAAFGAVLLATPIGWVVAAIAGLIAITVLVIARWDHLSEWWRNLWGKTLAGPLQGFMKMLNGDIWEGFQQFVGGIANLFLNLPVIVLGAMNDLVAALTGFNIADKLTGFLPDWVKSRLGITSGATQAGGEPAGAAKAAQARTEFAQRFAGQVAVDVNFANMPRGTDASAKASGGIPFSLNQGFSMAGP